MKILVPTDGSACALRAFKYAAKLASDLAKSAVISLSVHDHHRVSPPCAREGLGDAVQSFDEIESKSLRLVLDKSGSTPDATITAGHVAQEIVKVAEAGGFDLIVMGAKGRSPLCDLAMGSVAQKVVGATRLPVTLVK
jgi:nucleotide-binding universal stress UspA family protein